MKNRLLSTLVAASLSPGAFGGGVLYVDDDAAPAGDGQSWTTAFRFLKDAIAASAASGGTINEIRVAAGVYQPDRDEAMPTGSADRASTFAINGDVDLLGGYAGLGAPDPDAWDPAIHVTILTGDLAGDDGPGFLQYAENAYQVLRGTVAGDPILVEGFTIRAGYADVGDRRGAGVYLTNRTDVFRQCIFEVCWAVRGGAVYVGSGSPSFESCVFRDNRGDRYGGGFRGYFSHADFTDCRFQRNHCDRKGGGMYLAYSAPTLIACEFEENTVVEHGGAAYFTNQLSTADPHIERCRFLGNSAEDEGGAIAGLGTSMVLNCVFRENTVAGPFGPEGGAMNCRNPTIANCLFEGNGSGAINGGAVLVQSDALIINCLFLDNAAATTGGAIASFAPTYNPPPQIVNSIFQNNLAGGLMDHVAGHSAVTYCNLEGGLAGVGNIDLDPQFIDADGADDDPLTYEDNDYHLSASSPCIEWGNTFVSGLPAVDFDGEARVEDGDGDSFALVDIGPFEFRPAPPCPADLNTDGIVDVLDLIDLLAAWGSNPGHPADLTGDGTVDVLDLIVLLADWGSC